MSFINLIGNDIWSIEDITNRTEAMIHSIVSKQEENILSRKMIAFSMGLLVPDMEESALLTNYETISYLAKEESVAAQKDMKLLISTMEYEKAKFRLENPTINIPEIILDQDIIDSASPEIVDLYNLRHPVSEENQETVPENV